MKSVTINEIATNLNTSRNTVSKVLNGRGYVSDALKSRIVIEAVEKGYKNISPELLDYYNSLEDTSRPSSYTIAVIAAVPDSSAFCNQIITSITNEINATEHRLVFHFMTQEEEKNFSIPHILLSERIDGLIVINLYNPDAVTQIAELPIPKVYFDLPLMSPGYCVRGDVVLPEGEDAIYALTDYHIREKHCTKPVFVGNPSVSRSAGERYHGFRQALEDRGIALRHNFCLLEGKNSRFFYADEIENYLLSLTELPEVFVCVNDFTAYLLHQKLRELFPEQYPHIYVTGYDNLPPLGTVKPYLSTVDINPAMLGKKLVSQLFWRMDNPHMPYETVHLSTGILIRSKKRAGSSKANKG